MGKMFIAIIFGLLSIGSVCASESNLHELNSTSVESVQGQIAKLELALKHVRLNQLRLKQHKLDILKLEAEVKALCFRKCNFREK